MNHTEEINDLKFQIIKLENDTYMLMKNLGKAYMMICVVTVLATIGILV